MILCTSCGTRNPDHAHVCEGCKRKLQSRRNAPAPRAGAASERPEPVWRLLEPLERGFDDSAAQLVRACAEVWGYAGVVLASALVFVITEDWLYLACGLILGAGLAWFRKI